MAANPPDIHRLIVESATGHAILATDREGTITSWNTAAQRIFGWSEEEAVGKHISLILPPLSQIEDRTEHETREALEQGCADSEGWHQRKNGSCFWAVGELFPLNDDAGTPVGFVKVLRDRTPQHREKQTLQAQVTERDRLWFLSEDLMLVSDFEATVLSLNPAWQRMLGWREEDLLGRSFWPIVHPDDRDRTASEMRGISEGKAALGFVNRCLHKDGSYRWISWNSVPGENRLLAVGRNITEERQAEAALRSSEERYRALIEAGVSVVWRAAPDGQILTAEGRNEFLGQPLSAYVGQGWIERVHPEDQQKVLALWQELQSSGEPGESEWRVQAPDGEYYWTHAKAVPLKSPDGSVREWVGTLTDITKRRKLEEQLRQAQKMEAVGQLTGGIAHDFNNLLTVVLGNAEALVEEPSDPVLTRSLSQIILESAEKGADLAQHLLAFGRRQTLKPERLNLAQVVQGLEPILRRAIGEHIDLVTDIAPEASAALTDRTLLESAILNLVVNARDAMPEGGTLTIRTGERLARMNEGHLPFGHPVVYVMVSDTGTGMSPDVLSRAFEPFFTTKGIGKGSGLGLAMVYGFAEQSGGHVSIESQVGHGTAVTILLRAVSALPARHPSAAAERPASGKGKVLVVEDEAQVRQFVCAQLANLGYDVTAVEAGPEALNLLRQGTDFDLLFTDVVLPKGLSGVELVKRAREIKPDLKALLTSGYPEEVFQHHGRPERNVPLLRKPYRRKELAETLRKVLE